MQGDTSKRASTGQKPQMPLLFESQKEMHRIIPFLGEVPRLHTSKGNMLTSRATPFKSWTTKGRKMRTLREIRIPL